MKRLSLLVLASMYVTVLNAQTTETPETAQPEVAKEETATITIPSTLNTNSKVYDLMYMPEKGTFGGATTFRGSGTESDVQYQLRTFAKIETSQSQVEQELNYSIAENTLLGVELTYQTESEQEVKYGVASTLNGTTVKAKSEKGLEEPKIFFKRRLKNQDGLGDVNVDLLVNFAPKVGDAKSSTATNTGNALKGASEFGVGLEFGSLKQDSQSWKVGFGFNYTGKGTSKDATNSLEVTTTDGYGLVTADFAYQWDFASWFALDLGVGLGILGERKQSNPTQDLKSELETTAYMNLGAKLIFKITQKFVAEFDLVAVASSDYDYKETDTTTQTLTVLNYTENATGMAALTARYNF